jgi:hypothetical protein
MGEAVERRIARCGRNSTPGLARASAMPRQGCCGAGPQAAAVAGHHRWQAQRSGPLRGPPRHRGQRPRRARGPHAGQAVFGITVDRDGKSWFPRIFGQGGFALIPHPDKLTQALPQIYRQLVGSDERPPEPQCSPASLAGELIMWVLIFQRTGGLRRLPAGLPGAAPDRSRGCSPSSQDPASPRGGGDQHRGSGHLGYLAALALARRQTGKARARGCCWRPASSWAGVSGAEGGEYADAFAQGIGIETNMPSSPSTSC